MTLPIVRDPVAEAPDGDLRGPYGFGRHAHGSDPDARFGFDRAPHPLPAKGAPAMPVAPALPQRAVVESEVEEVILDDLVFRG